jgi:uncharacterized RDD family membrane protein YckC
VAAILLDAVILFVPTLIIVGVASAGRQTTDANGQRMISRSDWEALALSLIVALAYFAFLDGSRRGQTVGKMALGIAVRDARTGAPVGAARALGRRIFFFACYLGFVIVFLVNILWPLWDPRRQALHDKVAGTVVVDLR